MIKTTGEKVRDFDRSMRNHDKDLDKKRHQLQNPQKRNQIKIYLTAFFE